MTNGKTLDEFFKNANLSDIVCLNLFQIGELCTHLSADFITKHPEIPWKEIKSMRNIVAHSYGTIDLETVWETSQNDVISLKEFCRKELDIKLH